MQRFQTAHFPRYSSNTEVSLTNRPVRRVLAFLCRKRTVCYFQPYLATSHSLSRSSLASFQYLHIIPASPQLLVLPKIFNCYYCFHTRCENDIKMEKNWTKTKWGQFLPSRIAWNMLSRLAKNYSSFNPELVSVMFFTNSCASILTNSLMCQSYFLTNDVHRTISKAFWVLLLLINT